MKPILVVGGSVILALTAVLIAVLSRDASHIPEPPGPAPTPSGPGASAETSDAAYSKAIVGTWHSHKAMFTGAVIDTQATYASDGQATWAGTVAYAGSQTRFYITVNWSVTGGACITRVTSSNIPDLMPVGSISESRIISITGTEWTYVDGLDQQTETATRIR